jgi:hypothetical protein
MVSIGSKLWRPEGLELWHVSSPRPRPWSKSVDEVMVGMASLRGGPFLYL